MRFSRYRRFEGRPSTLAVLASGPVQADSIADVNVPEPKHKGVGLIAVVKGIQASSRATALVPEALRHYLLDPILPSGWYPERDYNVLITTLANSVDRNAVADVWAYFGRAAAQRDIAGDQNVVPARSRTENAGIYRHFRATNASDVGGMFLRLSKMWGMYHDTGRVVYTRHPRAAHVVVSRLLDFKFPIRGMAELQTAFVVEYARLAGISLIGALEHFGGGSHGCEWQYQVQASHETLASLASLSLDV